MKIVDLEYKIINNIKIDSIIKALGNIKFKRFFSILDILAIPKY